MKAPSPEFISAILKDTNRRFQGPSPLQFGPEELYDILPPSVLAAVEELCEMLPNASGRMIHVKWGLDDEDVHPGLPPYDEIAEQGRHERVDVGNYTILRRDSLVEVIERRGNSGGNVLFWFTKEVK